MKHEVSESEERVNRRPVFLRSSPLNGVQPGGHHDVILGAGVEQVILRDRGGAWWEEVARGGELFPPVTHGWAIAGDAVDVADVGLPPLAAQPELVSALVEDGGGARAKKRS